MGKRKKKRKRNRKLKPRVKDPFPIDLRQWARSMVIDTCGSPDDAVVMLCELLESVAAAQTD